MKKILPVILVLGGVAIGAIAYFGNQATSTKSSDEALVEAILDQQSAARDTEAEVSDLRQKVLRVPPICGTVTTGIFFEMCEMEPDEGQAAPLWSEGLSETEKECVLDTFHFTNFHVFEMQQKEYSPEAPSSLRVITFACDVGAAANYTDKVDYGQPDGAAADLIAAFHEDRAGRKFGFPKSY